MTNTIALTHEYISSTKSVLQAGRDLQKALKPGGNLQKKNAAITRLTEAGTQHDAGTMNFRALMFSEAETEAKVDQPEASHATEHLFANMVNDLEVANVYIAAGQNLGETNEAPKPYLLDDALNRLDQTSSTLQSFLTEAKVVDHGIVRYGFAESEAQEAAPAPDPKSAVNSFKSDADAVLKLLVDDAEGVILAMIDDLKRVVDKIGLAKILEIFQGLGGPIGEAPKLIGNFITLGLEKIKAVMKAIEDLLGSELLSNVSAHIVNLYQKITGGGLVSALLRSVFEVENTSTRIDDILALDGLDENKVLGASRELAELRLPYQNKMLMAKRGVKAVGLAAAILLVIPVAGVKVAAFAATAYGLILSLVVLVGMDYADAGHLLKRVRGVGDIAEGLRP